MNSYKANLDLSIHPYCKTVHKEKSSVSRLPLRKVTEDKILRAYRSKEQTIVTRLFPATINNAVRDLFVRTAVDDGVSVFPD